MQPSVYRLRVCGLAGPMLFCAEPCCSSADSESTRSMPSPQDRSQDKAQDRSHDGSGRSSFTSSLAQAERLLQIAFILPCAMLIGWGAGWWLDHHFHMHWATLVGLIVGIAAGMYSAIRMALDAGNPKGRR
jgi:ATP synthase protein I